MPLAYLKGRLAFLLFFSCGFASSYSLSDSASSDQLYNLMYKKLAEKYPVLNSGGRYYQYPSEITNATWYNAANSDALEYLVGDRLPVSLDDLYLPKSGQGGSTFYNFRTWLFSLIISDGTGGDGCSSIPTILREMNTPDNTSNVNYKTYTINQNENIVGGITTIVNQNGNSLQKDISLWRKGENLENYILELKTSKTKENQINSSVKKGKDPFGAIYTVDEDKAKPLIEKHEGFNYVKPSSSKLSNISDDESFSIVVKLSGLAYYSVSRAQWFDSNVFKLYKSCKLAAPHTQDYFFNNKDGILTLIPAGMLIGWNPTFFVTVSEAFYNANKKTIDTENYMVLGSMVVVGKPKVQDGSASGTKLLTYETDDENLQSLDPYILGYSLYKNSL